MSVEIHLIPYAQTFALPKDFIRQKLVGSLWADALELDPDAKEIQMTNLAVNPKALVCLVNLSEGKEPTKHEPDLAEAGRYLNLDRLIAYSDPLYDKVLSERIEPELLDKMAREGHVPLLKYLIQDQHLIGDLRPFLKTAFLYGQQGIAKLLLDTFPAYRAEALSLAVQPSLYDMVPLVLTYPDINLLESQSLLEVVRQGTNLRLALILKAILERGQEGEFRAMKIRIETDTKYQRYVAQPEQSLLLAMYLRAIQHMRIHCLSLLTRMFPLNSEEEPIMRAAFVAEERDFLYATRRGR